MRSTAVFKEEVEVEAAVCSIATLIIHISLSVRIFVLLSVPFVAMIIIRLFTTGQHSVQALSWSGWEYLNRAARCGASRHGKGPLRPASHFVGI